MELHEADYRSYIAPSAEEIDSNKLKVVLKYGGIMIVSVHSEDLNCTPNFVSNLPSYEITMWVIIHC